MTFLQTRVDAVAQIVGWYHVSETMGPQARKSEYAQLYIMLLNTELHNQPQALLERGNTFAPIIRSKYNTVVVITVIN